MDVYKKLGTRVRKKRKQLGISQEQLSEACCLSSAYIGIIERGNRKLSVETLIKIANALNVNTDYLLGDSTNFDNSNLIEKATWLLKDMDVDEIEYTVDLITKTKNFINKNK